MCHKRLAFHFLLSSILCHASSQSTLSTGIVTKDKLMWCDRMDRGHFDTMWCSFLEMCQKWHSLNIFKAFCCHIILCSWATSSFPHLCHMLCTILLCSPEVSQAFRPSHSQEKKRSKSPSSHLRAPTRVF